MLRLLALLVALLAPSVAPSAPEPAPGWTALDATLPASNSWFAYALTAQEDLLMDMRSTEPGTPGGALAATLLLLTFPDRDESAAAGGGFGWGPPIAQLNLNGARVACCETPTLTEPPMRSGSEIEGIWLAAGETMWITYVAANAEPRFPPTLEVRADGAYTIGERREGTDVRALDLADEAYRNGRNVRALGRTLVGASADAQATLAPARNALVVVDHMAEPGSSMRLTVDAAGERLLDREAATSRGGFALALAPAPVTLLAEEVEGDGAVALALLADIDVPGRAVFVHRGE